MVSGAYPKPSSSQVERNFLNLLPPQRAIMVFPDATGSKHASVLPISKSVMLSEILLITTTNSFHQNF